MQKSVEDWQNMISVWLIVCSELKYKLCKLENNHKIL